MATSSATSRSSIDTEEIADSSCSLKTDFTILKCNKTWDINNFSSCWMKPGERLESPTFSSKTDSRIEWCLSLYPAGKNVDNKDNLSLYLTLVASYNVEIRVKYKFSILNDKGEASKLHENTEGATLLQRQDGDKPSCGAAEFVSRSFLMNTANGLLPDDKLTISCELSAATIIPSDLTPYSNNILQTDGWGYTQVKVVDFTYLWTISNFSFCKQKTGTSIISPLFSAKTDNKFQWKIYLYPNGMNEANQGNISVYLSPVTRPQSDVLANFRLSVVHSINRKVGGHRVSHTWAKNETVCGHGWPQLIKKEDLFNMADKLLPDDKLKIYCEVSYVTDTVNISEDVEPIKLPTRKRRRIADDLEVLFENKKHSDVTLVAHGREFRAHKAILAARSPVFSAMFEYKPEERNREDEVKITNINCEVLQEVLLYIYTGTLKNLDNIASVLLEAADLYILEDLKFECEQELCSKLSIENVVDMLILADKFSAEQLKMQSIDFINAHAKIVVDSQGFKKMAVSHPQLLSEIAVKRLLNLQQEN